MTNTHQDPHLPLQSVDSWRQYHRILWIFVVTESRLNSRLFVTRYNEDPEYAVEQLQRYILDVPFTFEFRPSLVTNLRHLGAALAREEHYSKNMRIQLEGSPWNNCEGNRTIFTGVIALQKKRQQLFFCYGKSFDEWRSTVQMHNTHQYTCK
jgi:hypothetical protein